jgi:small ligand-binding sensory domain FIST
LAKKAHPTLQAQCLIGCPGETIVGNDREIENGPAMSLWLSKWSQPVRMTPFHLYLERTSEGGSILGWPDALVEAQLEESAIIMVADPYTFPPDVFLKSVNNEQPGLRVMGGMASGVNAPGECKMMQDGWQIDQGALGVLLEGPIGVRPVVSQGCRPIGKHMVITRAEKNIIQELGGKSPLEQLQELWQGLPPHEQELMQQGFHVGRVMNEHQGEFYQGDFLIRNVMGLDRDTGALVMADRFRVGQTVQFHVRDAESADQDLHDLLKMDIAAHEKKPSGALLFSCNGRGSRLFETPNHDAQSIQEEAGAIPIAGFFAQGELGPVGSQNFIHGFTASVVLFED